MSRTTATNDFKVLDPDTAATAIMEGLQRAGYDRDTAARFADMTEAGLRSLRIGDLSEFLLEYGVLTGLVHSDDLTATMRAIGMVR